MGVTDKDGDVKATKRGHGRCGRIPAFALVLVMGAMASGTISRNVAAQGVYRLNGWDGNSVIYLTEGISSTTPYVIQGQYNPQKQAGSGNGYNIANAVNVSVGQAWNTTNSIYEFSEYYYGGGSNPYMEVHVPIVAGGGTQQDYNPTSSPAWLAEVIYQTLSLGIGNSPASNTALSIQPQWDSGINTTGNIPEGTTKQQALVNEGIAALGSLPYQGFGIGTWSYENGLAATTGVDAYKGTDGANGQVFQNFGTTGGGAASSILGGWYNNVFDPQEIVFVDIPESEWMSYQPVLTITATNVVSSMLQPCYCTPVNGATASVTVNAVPAVTLVGQVTAAGKGVANAAVSIYDPYAGVFQLNSDSRGGYRFYAKPGETYTVSASLSTAFGTASSSSYTITMPSTPITATQNLPIGALSDVYGTVYTSGGIPISGATATLTNGAGTSESTKADSNGQYLLWTASLGPYTVAASASGWHSQSTSLTVGSFGASYGPYTFYLTAASGGGAGCVLAGTLISTPNGGQKRVEQLSEGDAVLGYNVTTGSWVKESVTSNTATNVNEVLSVNNGLLETTLTDQPLYVRNGTWTGWVRDPQNLTAGEQLFNPWTNSWTSITSLRVLTGTFTVYDLRAWAPNDFVANGILADMKT